MRTIICLLSDQPIPNLLFIRHVQQPNDKFIFLSTAEMEGKHKSTALIQALGVENIHLKDGTCTVKTISPFSPLDINSKLESLRSQLRNQQILLNITGGTKIMSQVCFQFFSTVPNTTIYYWPDSNNKLLTLFPDYREMSIANTPLITLNDYLLAHGYSSTQIKLEDTEQAANQIWQNLLKAGDAQKVPEIEKARNPSYIEADKAFLTGGWFEEWLYYRLKEKYQLANNQIALSVQLHDEFGNRPDMPARELDVVYVHNHSLYFWEAKVYTMSAIKNAVIMKDLFKLSAVRQMLGLKAQANFAVAAHVLNNHQRKETLEDMARTLNLQHIWDIPALVYQFKH